MVFSLVKNHLKNCCFFVLDIRLKIKCIGISKLFLKKGIYCIPIWGGKKAVYKNKPLRDIPKLMFFVSDKKEKYEQLSEIEYNYGCGKIVILTEDKAYGFFKSEKAFYHAKDNYNRYSNDFNYSFARTGFDDNKKVVIMDRIIGTVHNDEYFDRAIIKKLLENAINSKVCTGLNGEAKYVQHGDAARLNVIWNDEEDPVFIDLDNIGYYPPLLDVFHYLCMADYSLEQILLLLKENESLVNAICQKCNIAVDNNPIDRLLYGYVKHYTDNGICYEDFAFANENNTKEFPLTNSLLKRCT